MECFLKRLSEDNPRASLTSIGKSFENRDLWMVHVRPNDPSDSEEAGAVWIEAGQTSDRRLGHAECLE